MVCPSPQASRHRCWCCRDGAPDRCRTDRCSRILRSSLRPWPAVGRLGDATVIAGRDAQLTLAQRARICVDRRDRRGRRGVRGGRAASRTTSDRRSSSDRSAWRQLDDPDLEAERARSARLRLAALSTACRVVTPRWWQVRWAQLFWSCPVSCVRSSHSPADLPTTLTGASTVVAGWHRPADVVAALAVSLIWTAAVAAGHPWPAPSGRQHGRGRRGRLCLRRWCSWSRSAYDRCSVGTDSSRRASCSARSPP